MSIDVLKIRLLQRLLTVEDQDILMEIEKILDRELEINPLLATSIQEGLENIRNGETIPHEEAGVTIRNLI